MFRPIRAAFASIAALAVASTCLAQNPFEPTKEHKLIAGDVGVWDAEVKAFTGPDTEPMISKGTETVKALGDLWTVSDFKGEFGGQEFSGHGITGYDASKKKFVGIWVDTMSLAPMTLEGTYDEATKSLTMLTEGVDPATKQPYKMKEVITWKDKDHRNFVMYMNTPGGKEEMTKAMEISYTRKK
jgi:Protein of unknown function (DUF1579)